LSEAEIQRMVKDAEANAAEDKKQMELVTSRNQLDSLVHSVRKSLKDYGDKLSADEKSKIEAAVEGAEEAMKSDDKKQIDDKAQALAQAAQKLGEKMYADQQKPGPAGEAEPKAKPADDGQVVDAEFTEVKDRKG
jgi:molecular chaperone DnaK